ncbi:sugar transporter [Sphingobium sp. AS12]|uniref:sugar transporter n=1 Tax=Sphingobium sp. AS12 TaxID=2849495 RepID=UPI001C31B435|nr:sugar transporter [Sphingobium sp. AS12]MBV2147870.1 sugar transporter [Sphingobium sp. AS12]
MNTPRYFTIIAIILLLWNLMGLAAFAMQYTADLTELAKTDPTTAQAFAAMPPWVWIAYAIAVGAGTLGAIALLMKKAAAASLFLISVIAVIVQFGYTFLGTDLLAVKGAVVIAFPAFIVVIAIVQLLYARNLVGKGVLR